jgi:hypothetical protein
VTVGTFDSLPEARRARDKYLAFEEGNQDATESHVYEKYERIRSRTEVFREERELIRTLRERDFNAELMEATLEVIQSTPIEGHVTLNYNSNLGSSPFAVVASTADLHFGKRVPNWNGEGYDRKTAKYNLITTTRELIKRVTAFGTPEHIFLTIGGDDLHIDNVHSKTTKGTLLEVDGTPQEILQDFIPTLLGWVSMWLGVGAETMTIVLTPGNHNEFVSQAIAHVVEQYVKEVDGVHVHTVPEARSYFTYRKTLLGFSHGDDIPLKRLAAIMPDEARHLWSGTDSSLFFVQHEHHLETLEEGGVTILKHPTLSPADKWHSKKGYTSRQRNTAYIIHSEGGFTITHVDV